MFATRNLNGQVSHGPGTVQVTEGDGTSGQVELAGIIARDTKDSVVLSQQETHQAHRDSRSSAEHDLRAPTRCQPGCVDPFGEHGLLFSTHSSSVEATEVVAALEQI
ncbi:MULTISPECIES: hypothetical protein [Frigoribacterium]|uniref:hypothetical protein n=1 Tax=Frigoribacterium TaxID=96492 RepID=UPI00177FDC0D|nr:MULTISPECIES: hypothetical protein [Frigoribacterium]MBD8702840.1 hypothetical protein [Frigoribacterium sp. CFBP 13712]MCJ0700614.1 hypothetical protein [Frigoribacterium faeni]